jgi:threonine dehydrogenase-like Zn-dependent dehydrogenase
VKSMMKAAVVEKPGVLTVRQMPVPEIGDGEVLIKVKTTGICGTDWSIFTGKYSADKLPLIPGHEFSGVIAAVGKAAHSLKEGDRVTADINMSCGTCFYCRKGNPLLCPEFTQLGIHTHGTYAEYVKARWELVHRLPDNLDFHCGAFIEPTSCVIHSAKAMNLTIGSSVAVLGAGLGVLHGAMARLRGAAPVIVIGRTKRKLELAKRFGADHTLSLQDVEDPVAAVKELTGGRGADYVVEAVGTAETYELAFRMVRPGGTLDAFGITGAEDIMHLRPFDLVLGERGIVGSCAGCGNDWTDAIALLQYGRIDPRPLFSVEVPLEELESALRELREDKELTKVFVSPELSKRRALS